MANSFLQMLRKIEVGVERDGSISMPQIHLSPQTGKKFIAELESQPPEFKEEVERIQAEKAAKARDREEARKAKFKRRQG